MGTEQFNPFGLSDGSIDELADDNILTASLSDDSGFKGLIKALKAASFSHPNADETEVDFSLEDPDETNAKSTKNKNNQPTFDNWLLPDNTPTSALITPRLRSSSLTAFNSTNSADLLTGNSLSSSPFDAGVFTVGGTGNLNFEYLYDGGKFQGEMAIFNLDGIEQFTPGTTAFIKEAARRALTNSNLGRIVISDITQGAKFASTDNLGTFIGSQTFTMNPGDKFGLMIVPNDTVQYVFNNPSTTAALGKRALFSLGTPDPNDILDARQLVDVTGGATGFAWEDIPLNSPNSDRDYNDFIFLMQGAIGSTVQASDAMNPEREWRNNPWGKDILNYINSQSSPDTTAPVVSATLTNDTGKFSTDRLTNDPTIAGTIADSNQIIELKAGFNNTPVQNFAKITAQRLPDSKFSLSRSVLDTIYGGTLPDGTHTLRLIAKDAYYNSSPTYNFTFTLDTTPPPVPTFTLHPDSDSGQLGDNQTKQDIVTLVGQTEPNASLTLQQTGATVTSDNTGKFAFPNISLAMGDNPLTIKATDIAGNSSSFNQTINREECAFDSNLTGWTVTKSDGTGSVVADRCEAVLREGTSFDVTLSRTFEIPANSSLLTFSYANLNVDTAAVNQIKDAFEVALVDASGRSLVHTIGNGETAFFNLTESRTPVLAPGVTINGQTVSVDLSQLTPGVAATLQLRLVNNDSDINTNVRITDVKINSTDAGVPPVVIPASPNRIIASEINFNKLSDVSNSLIATYGQTSFNQDTKILSSDLAVKNDGQYPVKEKLLVGVTNISDPTVKLRNIAGTTPAGIPYLDYSFLLADGTLSPGESTQAQTLEFNNPNGVQFTYDLVFLSQVNSIPEFTTNPDIEAIAGQPYLYDVDAEDADKDSLTYSILSAPDGLAIDSATGKITWNPSAGDIGNHNIIIKVKDNFGGEATQQYNLSTINPPPNRPPIFTSIPTVDAKVNTPYKYEAKAKDDDGNPLIFSLVEAPVGMSVNPNTGVINWVPDGNQVGKVNIKLKVEDGAGGTASQTYQILTQIEPGNHAPIIVSEPTTQFNILRTSTSQIIGNRTGVTNPGYGSIYGQTFLDINGDGQRESAIYSSTNYVDFSNLAAFNLNGSTASINSTPIVFNGQPVLRLTDSYTQSGSALLKTPIILNDSGGASSLSTNFQFQITASDGAGDEDGPGADGLTFIIAPTAVIGSSGGGIGYYGVGRSVAIEFDTYNNGGADINGNHVGINLNGNLGSVVSRAVTPRMNNGAIWYSWIDYNGSNHQLDVRLSQTPQKPTDPFLSYTVDIPAILGQREAYVGFTSGTGSGKGAHDIRAWGFNGFQVINKPGLDGALVQLLDGTNGIAVATQTTKSYDLNGDGQIDPVTEQGLYSFENIAPGTYTVRQLPRDSWHQTAPSPSTYQVTIAPGTRVEGKNFGEAKDYFYPVRALDPDGDSLTYSLSTAPEGATIDAATGKISWFPSKAGQYHFGVFTDDGRGGRARQEFDVIVTDNDANAAPIITSTAPIKAEAERLFTYRVTASDPNYDSLLFKLTQFPEGMTVDPQTGVINWTPTISALGSHQVKVRVSDGRGGSTEQTFSLAVVSDQVNQSPSFDTTPPSNAVADRFYQYAATATDLDRDVLVYDLVVKPDGMVVDKESGEVLWKPTTEQIGSHSVVLRVSDSLGEVALQNFEVTVAPPNTAPAITSRLSARAGVNQPFKYQFKAQDAEGDPIAFQLDSLPGGMDFSSTGLLTWTPNSTQLGNHLLTVNASDDKGAKTTQKFNLEVVASSPNSEPIITSTPRKDIGLGDNYFYQVEVDNADSDPLTYALETHPDGMSIDNEGRISWQPTATQFGNNNIRIKVSDGRGGFDIQEYTVKVVSFAANQSPKIDSTPNLTATVDRSYQYNLAGSDPDGDLLLWSLDKAPDGMSIDPQRGTIRWTPTAEQVGEHEVAVRVMDSLGAYVGQAFTVKVRGVNVAPTITSTPPTTAAVDKAYKYVVLAKDLENDKLQFSLHNPPSGMTINRDTGLIDWIPTAGQVGEKNVEVIVEDSEGATTKQNYKILVKQTAENLPPAITSTPKNVAAVNQNYRYAVTATDPEGETPLIQLLEKPDGMTFNQATGQVEWKPNSTQTGVYSVTIAATDSSGAGGVQQFDINVVANQSPQIISTPVNSVTRGKTYRYDVKATDGNGDALVYSLTDPVEGMEIDSLGRITWSPSNTGAFPVNITVTDSRGASVSQTYNLNVVADNTAPKVSLRSNRTGSVDKGDEVSFVVSATDDVGVTATVLKVNNRVVPLDSQGRATVKMDTAGGVNAVATATDAAGNTGSASNSINVIDPSDIDAPQLNISSLEDDEIITAPIDIIGTVNDSSLSYYRLLVSPVDGGEFREVFRGTSQVTNGVLGKFDPSVWGNDSYVLKLEAADAGGNISSVERVVNVAGELKLGNFRLSFTDLEIPVAGIPINVTRTYDSLNANSKDDFGYGWRLEFRDTDLRTSLKKDEVFEQLGVRTVAFKDKTRVYITLPGGKREAFTFKPTGDRLNSYFSQPEAWIYHPAFEGDKGVTSKLTVEDTRLTHVGNEYFGLNGEPYNPADSAFGGKYVLTTKEGIVYEIDGVSGDLLTATDTNGNKVTFTDAGIFSDSGKAISFGRDAKGRITSVTDAMGYQVKYSYDEFGDLVKVTDQENRETKFIYDNQRTHYLKEIIDPLGRTGAKTEYDEKGRLKQVVNGANVPINMEYKPEESIQIVKDVYGKPTTSRYDERGNVLEVKDALGHSTFFEYDEDNNLTQSKDANNLVTKYDYDEKGNLKSRTEAYCGCPTVVPGTTYYTYNQYGQPTSVVLPTGASMKMEYDRFGNMLSMKDGKGSVIQSFTYYPNGEVKTETDTTGTTSYFYDNFGNLTKSTDPDGKATTMEYFADGKLKKMVEDQGTTDTADDETSTFTYDKLGREKRADYGNGIWVEYGYGVESDWSTLTAPTIGTIQRKFTDDGKLKGWVTPDGGTPTFLYDQAGRLWRETDATGKVTTEYGYDDAGRVTTIKDVPTGAITRKKYDAGNRPIEEVDPLGGYTKYAYHPQNGKVVTMERGKYITNSSTGQLVVDPVTNQYVVDTTVQKQVWNYEYNGLQTTVIDPLGRKTTSVQDEYYLPTETIYKQREGIDWSTQTKYLYTNNLQEAKDYPTKIIDISGRDRDFTYDSEGRLWKATDLANNTYTYTYGDDGLELIESPTSQTNSVNIKETLRYGYDALGNLNKVTYGDGKIKQMNYRSNDNSLGTTTLPSGETITYDYDAAGRIKSETTKSVNGTVTNTVSYTYDANSNVKTATDNTGTTTYHYDPNTGANIGIDYPNGSSIAYTHDLLGRVKTITEKASPTATAYVTTYDYDAFGNLKSVLDPSGNTTTMKYDVGNRLKERLLPNGVKSVYEYDELDRVKSIIHTNASGTVLASVTYERKGVGEPTKVTREDGSYVLLEYDEALRVKKESYYNAAGTLQDETSYGYDAAGKRVVQSSTVSGSKSFNYKAGYQLDSISGAVSEDYDYDANGRLTLIVRDGKTLDLEHDASDRLTAVENETTGNTIRYTYDGQGRRVTASEGTSQRRFLVAPAMGGGLESTDLISDANGNLISNYVYAGGSSPFMRLDASGNPIYYLTDAMGSTIGLADGTGASAAKFNYDSFGNLRSSSGAAANTGISGGDFRFQGQWLEQGTGIYNFRARDYDSKTGMFLSRDPVDIIETEPESFNPYQFVYNNPHVYSDPTGMFTLLELNASQTLDRILTSGQQYAYSQARQYLLDQARGVVGNIFQDLLGKLLPFGTTSSELLDVLLERPETAQGRAFERVLTLNLCEVIGGSYGTYLSRLWLQPSVSRFGEPTRDGFGCISSLTPPPRPNFTVNLRGYRAAQPDFIIKQLGPASFDHARDSRYPKADLIGDVTRTLQGVLDKFNDTRRSQIPAIMNYAKYRNRHQYQPIALFVTLFGGDPADLASVVRDGITKYGVVPLVATLLPQRNGR